MKIRAISQVKILLLIVCLLAIFTSTACGQDNIWQPYSFKPDQMYTYQLRQEIGGVEKTGELIIWIVAEDDEQVRIVVEGDFEGDSFTGMLPAQLDDPMKLFATTGGTLYHKLPAEVSEIFFFVLWLPWMETPFYNQSLSVGQEWTHDNYENEVDFRVVGRDIYTGLEGYVIETTNNVEYKMEVCINPEIPLPLLSKTSDLEENVYSSAELTDYEEKKIEPEMKEDIDTKKEVETTLRELVEYFRSSDLEIGETTPKAFAMIGAVDGLGLEVAGDEIELYLFDPEKLDTETAKHLEKARTSGWFWFEEMNMEIPVVMKGNIMLTGLEFKEVYVHPAKDKIIEVFESSD